MRKKLQIFVSSTYEDLQEERQSAVQAILRNRHIPAGMELFAAGDEGQMQVIKRWIDESDIFMLILGQRYGSIEPKSGKSYTQLEYEYAVDIKKPLFAVVLREEWAHQRVANGANKASIFEADYQKEFSEFYELVCSKMCTFAVDKKDIQLAIGNSIQDLEDRHSFSGWVSGKDAIVDSDALKSISSITAQNSALSEEVNKLRTKLSQLERELSKSKDFGGRSFDELLLLLESEMVETGKGDGGNAEDVSLMVLMDQFADDLVRGVTNRNGTTNIEAWLFFKVAPKLAAFGLAVHDKVPASVHWQRFVLSNAGKAFVTEYKTRLAAQKAKRPKKGDGVSQE